MGNLPYARRRARPAHSAGLFGTHALPPDAITAHIDGGARGNPGPAGYGVLIRDASGKTLAELSQYLGYQTNNFAEYSGLLAALSYALTNGVRAMRVISDSELLVRQINGAYKVKSPGLKELHAQAKALISSLDAFHIDHALREKNQEADRLANAAMDRGMGRRPQAAPPPSKVTTKEKELDGVVRGGVIHIVSGTLPEGTRVKIKKVE